MRSLLAPFLAALVVAGCMVGERKEGDTDGDFLLDEEETAGWNITVQFQPKACFEHGAVAEKVVVHATSDPYETDTDFDGVEDLLEFTAKSNPREPDTDGDGLSDQEEAELARNQSLVNPGHLSLSNADSDDDCMSDRDELQGYDIPGIGFRRTDPTTADTDSDGLTDPVEVFQAKTDPTKPDTDGDGAWDRLDVDPLRNLALEVRFDTLCLKGQAAGQPVRFFWSFPLATGESYTQPDEDPFSPGVCPGTSAVPAAWSPGVVDVDDAAGQEKVLRVDSLGLVNADTGRTLNLTPGSDAHILAMEVDPATGTWRTPAGGTGAADGSQSVIETPDLRFAFRVDVVEA